MEENSPTEATIRMPMALLWLLAILSLLQVDESQGQQAYVNNKQLECEKNYTNTLGYVCNGVSNSCISYLTFRSSPTYNSPVTIGYLLNADASQIARFNKISDVETIPLGTLVVVPVNCSCAGRSFYQHNSSYVLKSVDETYFIVANNTYQSLTTCQSMIAQNPYNYRNLSVGMRLQIPLWCACPTAKQTADGFKYLLTYLVANGDSVEAIGQMFGGVGAKDILDANELSRNFIFFFTPLLVPLKTEPININTASPPPSSPPPPLLPATPTGDDDKSSKKWVYVGVGIGAGILLLLSLSGFLVCFFRRRQSSSPPEKDKQSSAGLPISDSTVYNALPDSKLSWSVSSGVRSAIESLTIYKFEDLQKATGYFAEANRIKGSVYRGSFKGDDAAIKMMKGDVSREINILKQINHSNIIRLSGFCIHEGNTYLVYQYAEEGSLGDWLHSKMMNRTLEWKQRVQIAHDVADALNYLHNYTNPPYIHKNLKSSNVLLDGNMRAKVSNFGLARSLGSGDDEGGAQLTRHVVGTHGYMAPEYIENGLITPKLDVFAFGVVMLELLSGREAIANVDGHKNEEELLSATINGVLGGKNVREKLKGFIDPCLREEYPLDLAYSMAQLAKNCVAQDLNSRPAMAEVLATLSKIRSSSMDWDPSDELQRTRSLGHGR